MLHRRIAVLHVSVAMTATGLLLASATTAGAATAPSSVSLSASAYGSSASVGPLTSGRTAVFSGCSSTDGTSYGQKVAGLDLPGSLGTVGAVVTSGKRTGNKITVTSSTGGTSLLDGLISADAITSTSVSELSGSELESSGSALVTGLKIGGDSVTVPAGVGAHIDVPQVARLTFNNQKTTTTSVSKRLSVEALRVDLLKGNKLGLSAGTIIISSSSSGVSKATNFGADGQAFGTSVAVDKQVTSDPTAYVGLPCGGTGGEILRNSVTGVSVPGVVKVGAVSSTGQSIEGSGTTSAIFGNRVSGVSLLDGVVTADAVTVKAKTVRSSSGLKNYDTGNAISNLMVLGKTVSVTSKPNQVVDIAGLGTLTLNKTVPQVTGQDVIGIELKLSQDRDGVKAGTVVQVAVAKSRVAAR